MVIDSRSWSARPEGTSLHKHVSCRTPKMSAPMRHRFRPRREARPATGMADLTRDVVATYVGGTTVFRRPAVRPHPSRDPLHPGNRSVRPRHRRDPVAMMHTACTPEANAITGGFLLSIQTGPEARQSAAGKRFERYAVASRARFNRTVPRLRPCPWPQREHRT